MFLPKQITIKNPLTISAVGLLLIPLSIALFATFGRGKNIPEFVSSALVTVIFTGVGLIFAGFFLRLLRNTSATAIAVLAIASLVVFIYGLSLMHVQQDEAIIFSPALLTYPALGLVLVPAFLPLLETPDEKRRPARTEMR